MPRGRPRKTAVAAGSMNGDLLAAAVLDTPAGPDVAMPRRRGRASGGSVQPLAAFTQSLVLNQWLFGLFGLESTNGHYTQDGRQVSLLDAFKRRFQINEHTAEGLNEANEHRFHMAMVSQITGPLPGISETELRAYDQNIVRHTLALNAERLARRLPPLVWKYYQYLALLFVEIYLDRYFSDASALAVQLNAQIDRHNEGKPEGERIAVLDVGPDAAQGLNKLALWCATGSGKTLLMHLNMLQYRHYLAKAGRARTLNRIVLLTPNEGLSTQHLKEFGEAGIEAELFSKAGRGLFAGKSVEIIDIHKLIDEDSDRKGGEKSINVAAFETGNLVLVDEGHRGTSGGEAGKWLARRDQLCEGGFSFEYSATFKQAVRGSPVLDRRYAKSIIFDYSYRYFYGDGFGKDYQILNLDDATQQTQLHDYLIACLLASYQQRRLFDDHETQLKPFNIERPLWVFVGGSVNAVRTVDKREVSDVTEVLLFLATFVADRSRSVAAISRILSQGLVTAGGKNLFGNRFAYLAGKDADEVFGDVCMRLFNAPNGGALHVELLKGADGELALRIGNNDPFGVINVGDSKKLWELCGRTKPLVTDERDFAGSLFNSLDRPDSRISVLIGSRKFTEGWNSWRVNTLGLMKIGQSEGAQIIQLFGRGVRLKGHGMSLKRSTAMHLPPGTAVPKHLASLETLNVFGIHSDYMAQFRQFLEDEGLPPDQEREEIVLPVVRNLGVHKLKFIRLKPIINGVSTEFGKAFRKLGPVPTLAPPVLPADQWLIKNRVTLNSYPKIEAIRGKQLTEVDGAVRLNAGKLNALHVALLDIDGLWFELLRYKAERGLHNLNIPRAAVTALLDDSSWYDLLIPPSELALDRLDRLRIWQEIAETLLKQYTDRYYVYRKKAWEEPHLEYAEMSSDSANFPDAGDGVAEQEGVYRVWVEKSEEQLVKQLQQLREHLLANRAGPWSLAGGGEAIRFGRHLFEPLLKLSGAKVEVKPVALNESEFRFVRDLKAYCEAYPERFLDEPLYLLRNMSRGRGIGFFEAGNFHPDFIVWRVAHDGAQRITFVDPKGLHHLGWNDPKITFGTTIKEIEARLRASAREPVTLESCIASPTPKAAMTMQWCKTESEMHDRHVFFQDDPDYIDAVLNVGLGAPAET